MPDYRRIFIPGGTYFFTLVTYQRKPIFQNPTARTLLRGAWLTVARRHPFQTIAVCLLPDHLQCIWTLTHDADFSLRWKEIKKRFSHQYIKSVGRPEVDHPSRDKRGETAVWQRRFWEHLIRDETDFNHHLDYIHYNPVKHGLVEYADEWLWSTYRNFIQENQRNPDSGQGLLLPGE